jgi:hypothetical protein
VSEVSIIGFMSRLLSFAGLSADDANNGFYDFDFSFSLKGSKNLAAKTRRRRIESLEPELDADGDVYLRPHGLEHEATAVACTRTQPSASPACGDHRRNATRTQARLTSQLHVAHTYPIFSVLSSKDNTSIIRAPASIDKRAVY